MSCSAPVARMASITVWIFANQESDITEKSCGSFIMLNDIRVSQEHRRNSGPDILQMRRVQEAIAQDALRVGGYLAAGRVERACRLSVVVMQIDDYEPSRRGGLIAKAKT